MPFSSQTVLVTGASSGIGEACARVFAASGARLLLCARRLDRLEQLSAELVAAHGAEVHAFALDVRDRIAVEEAFAGLPEAWQEIDVLINNAGLSRGLEPLQDGSHQDWDEMLDTNVKGLLNLCRTLLPKMVERGVGQVINIGSIAGHEVYPGGAVYCASEFSSVRFHGDKERADRTYDGMTPLSGTDVAETVHWVASRPAHVNAAEILLLPADQATCGIVHRRSS
ncbi:MAG: SDR family NAD(P)-dependent oxidoreductase [Planctomycetota bacterium]